MLIRRETLPGNIINSNRLFKSQCYTLFQDIEVSTSAVQFNICALAEVVNYQGRGMTRPPVVDRAWAAWTT